MLGFFWTRSACLWMAVLYMALGLILLLFPEMTGTLFCWALAAACVALAVSRFARWRQASRRGYNASGELVVGVLFTALALFCVLGSRILLSFVRRGGQIALGSGCQTGKLSVFRAVVGVSGSAFGAGNRHGGQSLWSDETGHSIFWPQLAFGRCVRFGNRPLYSFPRINV